MARIDPTTAAIDKASTVHRSLLELPRVAKASILIKDSSLSLQIETTHSSTTHLTKQVGTQTYVISRESLKVQYVSPLTFQSDEIQYSVPSPNGEVTALFRKVKLDEGKTKRVIEFWNPIKGAKAHSDIDVTETHGDWYVDQFSGVPRWDSTGSFLVYTAEDAIAHPQDKLDESHYAYTPDIGEVFTGKRTSNVYVVRTTSATVHPITRTTSEGLFWGQPAFLTSGVLVAIVRVPLADGRRLGLSYCCNRHDAVAEIKLTPELDSKSISFVSPQGRSARSVRVLDESRYIFISNAEGGPHNGCASVHLNEKGTLKTLVGPVDNTIKSRDEFPGVFTVELPRNPFVELENGANVVINSIWASQDVPLAISLKDGTITRLASPEERGTVNVIAAQGPYVVALKSTPLSPPELVITDARKGVTSMEVLRRPHLTSLVKESLDALDFNVFTVPGFEPSEVVHVYPRYSDLANPAPLITFPHGGPHSTNTTDFSDQVASLAIAGYQVALVNYPGSLGFGQKFVDDLTKDLGGLDVECTRAVQKHLAASKTASLAKGKKLLMGGSHGGYISTHLSGRYPDEFDAVVLRNPVTDLTNMASATDIPDWVYTEVGLPYPFDNPPTKMTPEVFQALFDRSPMSHVEHVKLPTLLLVGQGDRRVPPDQSRNWFHGVSNNRKKFNNHVEMKVFPGNGHALISDIQTQILSFELGLKFVAKYTKF